MSINITGNVSPQEQQAYVNYLENKYDRKLESLDIKIDGLVGTMEHWNNAKSAEEHDRVKHDVSGGLERL